jgi:hypothetical protein
MAVVHVELDIDGDVYPELYATLAALRQPMLRDERMRQLASMGLAWEAVRLRGAGVMPLGAEASGASLPAVVERAASTPRSASRAAAKGPARKSGGRAGPPDAGQLPVLVDVVSKSPSEVPAVESSMADDGPMPPVDPMPITAANRGAGSRSRLLRMKDRGLFKND